MTPRQKGEKSVQDAIADVKQDEKMLGQPLLFLFHGFGIRSPFGALIKTLYEVF